MSIQDFIEQYKKSNDQDKYLSNAIITQYIPYHEKIEDCDKIVKVTLEQDGVFKINTPAQYMIFMIQMIIRYTDIELSDNMLEMFEALDELNLIDGIVSKIPEREKNSYNTILSMVQNDYIENNRSLLSFIETKVKTLGLSFDAILDAIQKYVPQNESGTDVIEE